MDAGTNGCQLITWTIAMLFSPGFPNNPNAVAVSIECGSSADLLDGEVRPHNATALGTALYACPGAYPLR